MMRRAVSWAVCSSCLALSLAHCEPTCARTPPEPVAVATARPKQRCHVPTPDSAPPAPPPRPDPRCPNDPDGRPPEVPHASIVFPVPNAPRVDVEVMLTEAHRNRGLMYRREMPEDHGMLFVFDDQAVRTFWMHNTCLPLDMLFVAADGYVTGILEGVPTMNDDPRSIPCKVKYVLEVNSGFARRHGVKAGQTLKIDGL